MKRLASAFILALTLAACSPRPDPARPALWHVEGPHGEAGWLFGTIHALPRPAAWRTPAVEAALAQSDRLVVEVASLNQPGAVADAFQSLAHTPGQPALSQRVAPALRPALARLMAQGGYKDADFADVESWAAALMLAQVAEKGSDTGNGIDTALLAMHPSPPVAELEGARGQLSIFDQLPENAQRALLAAVVDDTGAADDIPRMAQAWRSGDMATIAEQTHSGMLADPTLHEALFAARNRRWVAAIEAAMKDGIHPFVAVGAAHMAGPEGLPAQLAARGWRVTRVE